MTDGAARQPRATEPVAIDKAPYRFNAAVLAAAGVFAAALALYAVTLAPTVTLVDSGELIVAARTLGVAHPPGFPLYVFLAHLASLVPVGSVAARINFASAFFAALCAATVCLAVIEAITSPSETAAERVKSGTRKRKRSPQIRDGKPEEGRTSYGTVTRVFLPAATAGMLFACSRTLWAYATIAEVYTLNSLLIALCVFCLFRWRRLVLTARPSTSRSSDLTEENDRWLNAAALFFGLGLGVHHVTVGLMLPAFAVLAFYTEGKSLLDGKRLLRAAAWALFGLAIYIYLPLAATRSPLMNWGNPNTLERFISHVTGWQYQVFFEARPERIGRQLGDFFALLFREFGPAWLPLALMLAAVGLLFMRRSSRGLFWFLVVAIAANLAYNVNYEIAEDKDAYYLPVFLTIAIAAALGIPFAIEATRRFGRIASLQTLTAALLLLVLPGISLASNFPFDNRRHYFIARDYVENMLSTVEPGGMLLTLDWQVYSPLLYLREIEGYRPDVVAIDINQLRRSWYFDYLERTYPETMNRVRQKTDAFLEDLRNWEKDPDLYKRDTSLNQRISSRFQDLILSLVTSHLDKSKVYVTQDIATYREGGNADWADQISKKYQLVPEGLVFALYSDAAFHPPPSTNLVTRGLTDGSVRFDDDDVVKIKVIPVYAGMLYNRGRYLAAANRHGEAIEAFKQALAIDSQLLPAERAITESTAALRKGTSK